MLGQSLTGIQDQTRADSIREKSRFLLWVTELLYAGSIAASKLAILSFYWRVFRYTSIRIPILVLIAAVFIWFTIRTFMVIFHRVPVQAYWDKTITRGRCLVNASTFFFCTILMRCLMDCIIFVLSVIEVAKMHLPWSKKLAVVGLFTSGIMHALPTPRFLHLLTITKSLHCVSVYTDPGYPLRPRYERIPKGNCPQHDLGRRGDQRGSLFW